MCTSGPEEVWRRNERAAAQPSPLDVEEGRAQGRGDDGRTTPAAGDDPVGAYTRRRNEEGARQPNPLTPLDATG